MLASLPRVSDQSLLNLAQSPEALIASNLGTLSLESRGLGADYSVHVG